MAVQGLWQALENSALGQFIASSAWAFPTLESIHVIAIVTVVGSIAVMDLRLLGLASSDRPVSETSHDVLPWTWGAFVLAAVTGGLLFISKATNYAANPYFMFKLALIVLAGANMAAFHLITWRNIGSWDSGKAAIPTAAKLAGGFSLALWVVVVFLARAIGFTLDKFGGV
jgi:hypothetical protein